MLTAGFRWAPETLPMNKMMAMTIKAGATTAAVRLIVFGEGLAHHAPAGGHQDQEERAEKLREQAPPLLARVVEVGDAVDDALLVASERAQGTRLGCSLFGGTCGWFRLCGHCLLHGSGLIGQLS